MVSSKFGDRLAIDEEKDARKLVQAREKAENGSLTVKVSWEGSITVQLFAEGLTCLHISEEDLDKKDLEELVAERMEEVLYETTLDAFSESSREVNTFEIFSIQAVNSDDKTLDMFDEKETKKA